MTSPSKIPFERLRSVLLPLERIAIALSGGLDSSVLLQGHKTVAISHNGSVYRLQATKLGKLILTK